MSSVQRGKLENMVNAQIAAMVVLSRHLKWIKSSLGEARASLPSLVYTRDLSLDDIFGGISLQRLRLKQDQQVPEWQ